MRNAPVYARGVSSFQGLSDTDGMQITMGAEIALSLHTEAAITYTDVESVLVDAGFTNYTIMRNVNMDGTSDVQLFVRSEMDENGYQGTPLPAVETMQALSEAIEALALVEPPEEPPA